MDVNSELKDAQLEIRDTDNTYNANKKGLVWFNRAENKVKAIFNSVVKEFVTKDQLDSTDAAVAAIPPIVTKETSIARSGTSSISGDKTSWTSVPGLSMSVVHGGGPIHLSMISSVESNIGVGGYVLPKDQFWFYGSGGAGAASVGYFINGTLIDATTVFANFAVDAYAGRINIRSTSLIKAAGTYTIDVRYKFGASAFGASSPSVSIHDIRLKAVHT